MCGNSECVCRALTWISLPIWLPIYAIAAPTYQCGGQIWRSYVRPAGKYSVPKPLPRRRVIRHQLSLAKLPKVETKAPPAAVAAGGAKQCGFWKLPIEIRMMIWKELLLLEYGGAVEVRLTPKRRDGFRLYSYDAFRNLETTILRVSRQFYLEGMQILYQQNDFRIRSEATLSSFARRVAPTRLAMVHTLQFAVTHFNHRNGDHRRNLTFDARSWKEACRDLQRFTGLRKLRITLKFELGAIWHRCFTDPVWTMKFFGEILGPLEDIKLTAGAEFIVGYTWSLRICDSWRRGQFEMKHISDGMIWWD